MMYLSRILKINRFHLINKLLVIIITIVFTWTIFVTANPIKPQRLTERFYACDLNDINSWVDVIKKPFLISSTKSFNDEVESHIQFTYKDTTHFMIQCKKRIPKEILFRAKTINIKMEVNQPIKFDIGIHRVGQGPGWQPQDIGTDEINKIITLDWQIDSGQVEQEKRLNWLSGDYEAVSIGAKEFDENKDLIITIYSVFLD